MKLDSLDKKILALIAQDGSLSRAEIARTLDENERKVIYRVNTLIEKGAISIVGVINPEIFGYGVLADIYVDVELSKIKEIAGRISEFPEVRYVQTIFGDHDITLQVIAKSTADLDAFVTERLAKIPGITRATTAIVARVWKEVHEWMPEEVTESDLLVGS